MTHNELGTTMVTVQVTARTILDCLMKKLPSRRKYYRVTLIVPDNGFPIIEYYHHKSSKKPRKTIQFVDVLFADIKHDTNKKNAFSIYTIDKTITFLAQDETTMNEWLSKIKECHMNLYPEFKRYDSIFEANLLDKGLVKQMNIHGPYRLALCKDSLDLYPLLTAPHLVAKTQSSSNSQAIHTNKIINSSDHHELCNQTLETKLTRHHHHLVQSNTSHLNHNSYRPMHQRFHKRHPLVSANTIELVIRSIRRYGHTGSNFYVESGRHSQVGEGDLWMALNKESTARQVHELLLATKNTNEESFLYKATRSRERLEVNGEESRVNDDVDDDSGYLIMS